MKVTKELLLELKDIPTTELLLLTLFIDPFTTIPILREFAVSLPAPFGSDFARALVNAPVDANEALLDKTVGELAQNEYPELYVILEAANGNTNNDL